MKTLITILNGLAIALAAYLVIAYSHTIQALHMVVFGMALGVIHGEQKKSFKITALVLNVGYFLFGSFGLFLALMNLNQPIRSSLNWLLPMVIMFFVVPLFNIRYVYQKIKT